VYEVLESQHVLVDNQTDSVLKEFDSFQRVQICTNTLNVKYTKNNICGVEHNENAHHTFPDKMTHVGVNIRVGSRL
jgi:hypothetical protein